MKKMKRFLSLLLCMMMLVSLLPAGASAAGRLTLRVSPRNSGTVTIVSGADWQGNVSGDLAKISAQANEGYEFVGWKEGDTNISLDAETTVSVSRDRTLTAHFNKLHRVSFYWNDGTNNYNPYSTAYVRDGASVEAPVAPKRDGYRFTGWATRDGGFNNYTYTDYDFSTPVKGNLWLFAQWEEVVTHDVNFHWNYTGKGVYETVEVEDGDPVAAPAVPTRTGYRFDGWYKESGCTNKYEFTTAVEGKLDLYAKWVEVHDVNFYLEFKAGIEPYHSVKVDDNARVEKPADPSKEGGYRFVRWTVQNNFGGWNTFGFTEKDGKVVSSVTITDPLNLVADWVKTWKITATAEHGTVEGAGTYDEGTTAKLTATPAEGYHFVKWTESRQPDVTANPISFTVQGDRALTAHFELNQYEVTASVSSAGGGTTTGTSTYTHGQPVTVTATPEANHVFVNWTENGAEVSADATYSFTATADRNLVANFVRTHTVTVTATPTEGGNVSGGGTFNNGQSVTVTAAPKTGYNFVNWTEDGTQVSAEASYTFTVNDDRALVANFVEKYLVSANVNIEGAGTVTGAGEHNKSTTAELTAAAASGYRFVNWTEGENVVGTDATISFTVTGPRTLTANFIATHTVTATGENGTVTGAGTYDHNAEATLTATPATGYHFVNWTENGAEVSKEATISFAVTANRNLVANFELNKYMVTATADPEAGAKKITGDGEYGHGSTATLTATADDAYLFQNWTEDGEVVSTDATYSFTVTGERDLKANFVDAVTVTFDAKGKATNPTTQKIAKGAAAVKPADPENANFNFDGWYVNADFSGEAYDFETGLDSKTTLYAKWTALHTVSFDLDGGTAEDNSKVVAQKIKDGGNAIKPDTKVNKQRDYHHLHDLEFLGWYLDEELYDFENTRVTGDITLKAKWGRMLHVINFYDGETLLKTVLVPEGETVASVLTADEDVPYLNGEWTCNQYDVHGKFDLHNKVVRTYCYDLKGKPKYEITFNGNGGTGTMENQDALHGVETPLNENKFSKTGYAFNGWKDAAGKDYADKANIKVTADTTLTAQWTAKTYNAVFKANGGAWEENEVTKTVPTVFGEEITKPADPTREGYEFTGWSPTNLIMDAEGKTFTAQWKAIEYTITYNGMEGATATPTNPDTYTIEDADITLTDPEKTGFRFDGWTNEDREKVEGVAIPTGSTGDKTFTATWVAQFTVTFDRNGHGTAPAAVTVDTGVAVAAPDAPSATGYTFGGWYTESACTTVYDFATAVTADVTLYAKWTPITYKVIFDPNGGELRTKSAGYVVQEFTYDAEQALQKNAYVLSGHSFKGWNTRKNGDGTSYADEAAVKNLASNQGAEVTLYAQWEKNAPVVNPVTKYKVTYDANGGRGTMGADTVEAGGEYTLLANKFTAPSGKVFKCWKINNKEYKPGEVITVDFDITVKAVWKDQSTDLDYVPATGDNFSGFLWALLMLSGAVALVEVAVLRRKRR